MTSARDRFLAYRKSLPRPPKLERHVARVRGLELAIYTTPAVTGALPLLCVNGGLIFDHVLLWPALSPLAERRQLVFFDQRGRGKSQAPPGVRAARVEHDAGDVRAVREALGLARWDVLGHSWGGGIAMLGVALDQEATRRLVLVDAVGPTGDWMPRLLPDALDRLARRAPVIGPEPHARLARFGDAELTSPDPETQLAWSRAVHPAWFADAELGMTFTPPRSESRTGAAVAARLRREGYDWRDSIRALHVPTLVIHGEQDLLPVRVAEALADVLPDARLALVPDAGHMPFWEAPERFFPLVERFLAADVPPSP